jgi:beta-glucosidase
LVQHADDDPVFQLKMLRLMEPLAAGGQVSPRNYALLYDRVMLQMVGTLHDGPLPKGRVEMTVDSDGTPQPITITLDHVSEDESFRLLWMPPAQPLLDQAVAAVRDADVAIVVAGLSPDLEGEALSVSVPGFVGGDRTDIALPLPQQRLLAALKATGKPIVLVLSSGSAVSVDPTSADAILANWYPGEAGGTALADVLSGVTNPGGRLPVTFYRATTDLPAFIDYAMKERTYRYFTGTPLWGFGHGLSYTRFGYAAPRGAASVAAGQPHAMATRSCRPISFPPPPPARSAVRRRCCNASSSATAA